MKEIGLSSAARAGCGGWRSLVAATALLLAGSASARALPAPLDVTDPATRCAAMSGTALASTAFGLPTEGAMVDKAVLVEQNATNTVPQMCQLTGTIRPAAPGAYSIHFQLNLPSHWNGGVIQFGGAGNNGVVVTGLGPAIHAPSTTPTPLMRGYATFGGDSGHRREDADWLTNKQAYANFAGESVKRTRDAAVGYIRRYYSSAPRRTYFMGGSKGGHEALVAAQRYGADYDGVIAFYPAAAAFGMQMSWARMGYAAQATPASRLSAAQEKLVKARVLGVCDDLDGAADGIVSNVKACRSAFALESVRCPDGAAAGDGCLSDPQIAGLRVAATPITFDFPLANGLTSVGPYPVLEGADFGDFLYRDRTHFWGGIYRGAGDDLARQLSGGKDTTWPQFDYRNYRPAVEALSAVYDASSTNLDRFKAHGAKLLLLQGTTDMLVPEALTSRYWNGLRQRYGSQLDRFARYYIQPGFAHGGGDFALSLDSLSVLERWVEQGVAPAQLIATDAGPGRNARTRPLCDYPKWPRYRGAGDIQVASSFECVSD